MADVHDESSQTGRDVGLVVMTLNKAQIEAKEKFNKWFWMWERDLLECAKRWPAWRTAAHELGFTDKKIDAEWTFQDAGRLIQYAENPWYKNRYRDRAQSLQKTVAESSIQSGETTWQKRLSNWLKRSLAVIAFRR